MSEPTEPTGTPKHWWSAEHRHSRRAAVGAVSICTTLALIVAVVWALPGLPVAVTAGKVAEVIANPAAALLKQQNERLASKVTGLRKEVHTRDAALAVAYGGDERAADAAVSVQRKADAAARPGTTAPAAAPSASTEPARPVRQPAAVPAPSSASTRPAPVVTRIPTSSSTKAPAPAVTTAPRPAPTVTMTAKPAPAPTVTVTAKPVPAPVKTPTPTPAKQTTPLLAALTAPSSRYFGLYTEQAPFNWATYDDAMTKLASSSQTVGYFSGWDEAFRANAVTRSWSHGLLPIMTWESRPIGAANNVVDEPDYSLHRIIEGDFDEYLRTYARSVVDTGLPLGIRLDHEMNGTWYPWAEDDGHGKSINGNSPGEYAAMWRHVHDVFQQEGANDYVFWIWSPNRINKLTATHRAQSYLESLYPGDDYVDWVGLSGYLRPAYAKDDDFSFEYTYGSTLRQLRAVAPTKRILLSEIGASETGGHKVAWLESLFDSLAKPENADVVGVLWFDLAVSTFTEGQLGTNDWRVDSRPETLAAFRAGMERTDTGFGPLPWDATGPAPAPVMPAPTPAPTPTPAPMSTPTATATPTPSATAAPTPTPTASPSPTWTVTP